MHRVSVETASTVDDYGAFCNILCTLLLSLLLSLAFHTRTMPQAPAPASCGERLISCDPPPLSPPTSPAILILTQTHTHIQIIYRHLTLTGCDVFMCTNTIPRLLSSWQLTYSARFFSFRSLSFVSRCVFLVVHLNSAIPKTQPRFGNAVRRRKKYYNRLPDRRGKEVQMTSAVPSFNCGSNVCG